MEVLDKQNDVIINKEIAMASNQTPHTSTFFRAVRKFLVSAFVVFTFVAYALHERLTNANATAVALVPTQQPAATLQMTSAPTSAPVAVAPTQAQPSPVPTDVPATQPVPTEPPTNVPVVPTAVPPTAAPVLASGKYKNGTYTGPEADAYYGYVQVQVTIQNGKIADVNFLDYPQDRRTSARINSIATPYLVTEAIQAQSANVDIISGATLTSEAFVKSLELALNKAQG